MEEPPLPTPPPLLTVTVVFRSRKIFDSLVLDKVTSFLDSAIEMALCDACKFDSVALLDRIWNSSTPESEPSPADAGPGNGGRWSRRKYLRTDPHYNRFQFRVSMVEAVKLKGMEVTRWLFNHFSGCIVPFGAVHNAAGDGRLDLLRFFLEHDVRAGNGALASNLDDEHNNMEAEKGRHFIRWGRHDLTRAVAGKQHETVWWLYQNTKAPRDLREALTKALVNGDIVLLDWLVAHYRTRDGVSQEDGEQDNDRQEVRVLEMAQDGIDTRGQDVAAGAVAFEEGILRTIEGRLILDFTLYTGPPPQRERNVLRGENATEILQGEPHQFAHHAGSGGHLSALEWLYENGFLRGDLQPELWDVVHHGGLDMVEWAISHNTMEAGRAIAKAVSFGCLDIAKPLFERYWQRIRSQPYFPLTRKPDLEEVYPKDASSWISKDVVVSAVTNGGLSVVKWLVETFSSEIDPAVWGNCDLMDIAAARGSLDVVKYLHGLDARQLRSANKPSKKKHKQADPMVGVGVSCTTAAMDVAAARNHLDVVQWLHENRPEGCTVAAMDKAAENGHLEMVQWLHANRVEGCTSRAMDLAAWNGHLDIVKWLHENHSEGCTEMAMEGAACSGHLDVVQWLHANRSEGDSYTMMHNAAGHGRLKVVDWLDKHRPQYMCCYNDRIMNGAAACGHFTMVEWLHTHRYEGCTVSAMDKASRGWKTACFDVILFLHSQRREGCSEEAFRNTRKYSPWVNPHEPFSDRPSGNIHDWLVEHYPSMSPRA